MSRRFSLLTCGRSNRQVQGGGKDHDARRRKTEERLDQSIGHAVIFCPADAVQEQVAQGQAGPKCGDEGPRTNFHALPAPGHQPPDRVVGVAVDGQGQAEFLSRPVGNQNLAAAAADKDPPALRLLGRPNPKWGFNPRALGDKVGHGMGRVTNAIDPAVLLHGLIVAVAKAIDVGNQVDEKPMKRLAAADHALRKLERLQSPLAFQLVPRLGQAIAQPLDVPRPFQHHRPEAPDERIGNQRRNPLGHAAAKAGKQIPRRESAALRKASRGTWYSGSQAGRTAPPRDAGRPAIRRAPAAHVFSACRYR